MNIGINELVQELKNQQITTGHGERQVVVCMNGERVDTQVAFDGYMLKIGGQYVEPHILDGVEFEVV
jgi:hypothetical protein